MNEEGFESVIKAAEDEAEAVLIEDYLRHNAATSDETDND